MTPPWTLQWGRRVNATESQVRDVFARILRPASMGPPRERDGELTEGIVSGRTSGGASMGPPRERDGERARGDFACRPLTRFNGAAA